MTLICRWLVDMLCRLLEPNERDAVSGDIAESHETDGQALWGVLGLVARRQAALWKRWRPWLVLACLVIPLGLILGLVARRTADGSAVYIWLYANNWNWADIGNAAFRQDFAHYAATIFLVYFTLFCWSWGSGLALGSLSRSSLPINGVLFGFVVLFRGFFRPSDFVGSNPPVFASAFYRVTLPLLVQALLVLTPALFGMLRGRRWRLHAPASSPMVLE